MSLKIRKYFFIKMLSLLISSLKMGQNQNGCPHNFQARQGKSAVDNYTILWLPRSYLIWIHCYFSADAICNCPKPSNLNYNDQSGNHNDGKFEIDLAIFFGSFLPNSFVFFLNFSMLWMCISLEILWRPLEWLCKSRWRYRWKLVPN